MTRLGHNGGPTMEPGGGWRRYAWRRARAELLPTLPLEVARRRVRRARELGIDYTTYAGIRAATGRDIVALLFSSNALALSGAPPRMPAARSEKLAAVTGCDRLLLAQPPHTPEALRATLAERHGIAFAAAAAAPPITAPWSQTRAAVRRTLDPGRLPGDAVLLVGETALEREWCAAGRLAGYLPAERYFGAAGERTGDSAPA